MRPCRNSSGRASRSLKYWNKSHNVDVIYSPSYLRNSFGMSAIPLLLPFLFLVFGIGTVLPLLKLWVSTFLWSYSFLFLSHAILAQLFPYETSWICCLFLYYQNDLLALLLLRSRSLVFPFYLQDYFFVSEKAFWFDYHSRTARMLSFCS